VFIEMNDDLGGLRDDRTMLASEVLRDCLRASGVSGDLPSVAISASRSSIVLVFAI
jgi:hypothetical protein